MEKPVSRNQDTQPSGTQITTSPESSGAFDSDFPAAPQPVEISPGNTSPQSSPSNAEPVTTTSSNEFITPATVTFGSKRNGFLKFIIIGILIIAVIYGVVFYLYLENKKVKESGTASTEGEMQEIVNVETPQPQPFSGEFVKLVNGNVVYESPTETKILINKESYASTGIIGFTKVSVSPDNSKICFESWPPATKPAVYLSAADGGQVEEISPNSRYCNFTPDSKKIIYEKSTGEVSDIYFYEIDLKTETNLTPEAADADFPKTFGLVGLSADGSAAICNFTSTLSASVQGQCEIDLLTREVIFK